MKYQNILMAITISLLAFSAQAAEEACVENVHVIGHDIRIAYVTGNLQNPVNLKSIGLKPLDLSQTYCSIPASKFRLAVYLLPNLNDRKDYPGGPSDALLVTNEEFNLDAGDYLGFNLSSDEEGKLRVVYARPKKNQFNQSATLNSVPAH